MTAPVAAINTAELMKPQDTETEQFESFKGIGKPWLTIERSKNYSSLSWGDGTLHRWWEFQRALDLDALNDKLSVMFHGNTYRMHRKGCICYGGVSGSWYYLPPDLGEAVLEMIRDFFSDALLLVEECDQEPGEGDPDWRDNYIKQQLRSARVRKRRERTRRKHHADAAERAS